MKCNDSNGLDFNYCALFLCALYPLTPEQAFYVLDINSSKILTDEDHKIATKMYENMTLKQIGKLLGIGESGVCKRIKRYKNKTHQNESNVS